MEVDKQRDMCRVKMEDANKIQKEKEEQLKEANEAEEAAAKSGDADAEAMATSKTLKVERELQACKRKVDQWEGTLKVKTEEDCPEAWAIADAAAAEATKAEDAAAEVRKASEARANAARKVADDLEFVNVQAADALAKAKKDEAKAKLDLKRCSQEALLVLAKPREVPDVPISIAEPKSLCDGLLRRKMEGHVGLISGVIAGNTPKCGVFSCGGDRTAKRWDVEEESDEAGQNLKTYSGHGAGVRCIALYKDSLFTAGDDNTAIQWEMETGVQRWRFEGHSLPIWSMCTLEDGDDGLLFTASQDRTVRCWDLTDGRCEFVFGGATGIGGMSHRDRGWLHRGPLTGVGVIGDQLISCGYEGEVHLWNRMMDDKENGGDLLETFDAHERGICCMHLAGTETNASLFTGSFDTTIKWWDLEQPALIKTFEGHTGPVHCIAHSGAVLYTGSTDLTVRAWNMFRAEAIRSFWFDTPPVSLCMRWTQDKENVDKMNVDVFVGLQGGSIHQYECNNLGLDEDFSILLDGERTRKFGELTQIQVKEKHKAGEAASTLRKLKRAEQDARRKAMLEAKKNAEGKEKRELELAKAKELGHFGDLHALLEEADPEEAARLKAEEDKARKAEMDAMKERLRQEQVMVDRFQEERAKQEAEAKRKVERAAAKLMRKNRSEELGKQKLVDLHRFKAEAKRLNAAFNKKY